MNTIFRRCVISSLIHIVATLALTSALSSCAFEPTHVSGKVIDITTKAPIEGAYVLAVYIGFAGDKRYIVLGHGGSSKCLYTAGMTTGKDGAFQFPYKTKSGATLFHAYAVKTGYFFDKPAAEYDNAEKNPTPYQKWEVLLVKQEAQPNGAVEQFECERPESKEATLANIEFLKITYGEQVRIGRPVESLALTQEMMKSLVDKTTESNPKK